MAPRVVHALVSTVVDDAEPGIISPNDWNDDHTITGLATSSTDKAIVRFSGTTGNQQNSGVTIDDSNIVAGAKVLATGTSTARTLESKLSDIISVKDEGAVGDGVTSDTAAMTAAATLAGDTGGILFPAGTYVNSSPTLGQSMLFSVGGAVLSGWPTGVDASIATTTPFWIHRKQSAAGTAVASSANQFTVGLFGYVPATSSAANYEKGLLALHMECDDPSGGGVTRDVGCIDAIAIALGTSGASSVFTANFKVQYDNGSTGSGGGVEVDSFNNSASNAGVYGSTTAKYGYTAFAYGSKNSSSAFVAAAGTSLWRDGFVVSNTGISDSAFRLVGGSFDYLNIGTVGNTVQTNSGADAYYSFVMSGVQAFSIGQKTSNNHFLITAVQGLGSNVILDMTSAGAATFSGSVTSTLKQVGAGSGVATLAYANTATNSTITLPTATDTLVGKATTDTFTNKTYDTAGTGNAFSINGTAVSTVVPVGVGGTGTTTAFTTGSIPFAGASGVYTQNNANFFWDNTNDRLGLGTASPQNFLHILQSNAGGINQFKLEQGNSSGHASFIFLHTGVQAWQCGVDGADKSFRISAAQSSSWTSTYLKLTTAGSFITASAAIATNATDGFLYIPTCAGTPTGTPTTQTGTVAMVYDTTNNKLYIYNGAWKGGTAPGAWS